MGSDTRAVAPCLLPKPSVLVCARRVRGTDVHHQSPIQSACADPFSGTRSVASRGSSPSHCVCFDTRYVTTSSTFFLVWESSDMRFFGMGIRGNVTFGYGVCWILGTFGTFGYGNPTNHKQHTHTLMTHPVQRRPSRNRTGPDGNHATRFALAPGSRGARHR